MNYKFLYLFIFLSISLTPINATSNSSSLILNHTPVQVCFSPGGGCTALIVHEIDAAKSEILVQAYSFTSAPIAAALVKAYKRGVIVKVILDKSQKKGGYSSATFLKNAGIQTYIDSAHAIAHNKIIIIDAETVITGSFNFTAAAEKKTLKTC